MPPVAAPERCPLNLTAKLLGKNDVPGITHSIVPGHPQSLVICGPSKRVVIPVESFEQQIVDEVNGLKLAPLGVFTCPMYDQRLREFGLFFNYPNGDVLLVQVGGTCNTVSNGHRAAFIVGLPLRTQIKGLLAAN